MTLGLAGRFPALNSNATRFSMTPHSAFRTSAGLNDAFSTDDAYAYVRIDFSESKIPLRVSASLR